MGCTITIRDESVGGELLSSFTLECLSETMSVREIIRARVYQEVGDYNQRETEVFRGLVEPVATEQRLNGVRLRQPAPIDWERQYEKAMEGFRGNAFFVLVNDRQAESLDETFTVAVDTEISFIKLLPLVGG